MPTSFIDFDLYSRAMITTIYGHLCRVFGVTSASHAATDDHRAVDRGAVSLEQVLWFVAAGAFVAVVAGILWNKIRDEANKPVQSPAP